MKKMTLLLALLAWLLGASGCSNALRKAVPINIANPGYEISRVSIAVDYFGTKHILRRECPIASTDNCVLIYSRATTGGVTDMWSWSSATGYSGVFGSDVAVTDSGVAFVVWTALKSPGGNPTTLFMTTSDPFTFQELMPGYISFGDPFLVSRFNVVYAISPVQSSGHLAYRYRQMAGGSAAGWISQEATGLDDSRLRASVSSSGWLHVIYYHSTDILYADNFGNLGNMTNRFTILPGAVNYSDPAIDVNGSPETVYLGYYSNLFTTEYNDALYVGNCPASACNDPSDITLQYPLDGSKHWDLDGPLGLVADAGTDAFFVFRATNADLPGNYDIFEGYTQNGIPQGVFDISSMPGADESPVICLNASYVVVTTWIHASSEIYEFETFPFFFYALQRKIYTTPNNIRSLQWYKDMSCNADWAAGIWIEDETVDRAYLMFNVYPNYLPAIKFTTGGSI